MTSETCVQFLRQLQLIRLMRSPLELCRVQIDKAIGRIETDLIELERSWPESFYLHTPH